MRRIALILLLVLLGLLLAQHGIFRDSAQTEPTAAAATPPALPTTPTITESSTAPIANDATSPSEHMGESYCAANLAHRTSAAALAHFKQRHSDIAIADADLKSLFAEMASIWHLAALSFIDHDNKTYNVIAAGKYQGRDIRSLEADAVGGDASAALHYGSYLMANAYMSRPQNGQRIDHEQLERGRNLLMQAHQAGQPDAIYRIYMNTAIAARMIWRWQGRTADWQTLDAEQYAWQEWLLQHGPSQAAAALVRHDRDNSQSARSPLGEPYPSDADRQPDKINRRVAELVQEIHAPALTATDRQLRDQFQWLHSRDLIVKVMFAWGEDCDPSTIDQ